MQKLILAPNKYFAATLQSNRSIKTANYFYRSYFRNWWIAKQQSTIVGCMALGVHFSACNTWSIFLSSIHNTQHLFDSTRLYSNFDSKYWVSIRIDNYNCVLTLIGLVRRCFLAWKSNRNLYSIPSSRAKLHSGMIHLFYKKLNAICSNYIPLNKKLCFVLWLTKREEKARHRYKRFCLVRFSQNHIPPSMFLNIFTIREPQNNICRKCWKHEN